MSNPSFLATPAAAFASRPPVPMLWLKRRIARLLHGPPHIIRKKTMKFPFHQPPARARVVFAVAALAAAAAAAAHVIAVTAVFNDASREPFLRDTPQNRQAVARCDVQPREARNHCVRRLVAAAKASDAGAARLAAAEPARLAQ